MADGDAVLWVLTSVGCVAVEVHGWRLPLSLVHSAHPLCMKDGKSRWQMAFKNPQILTVARLRQQGSNLDRMVLSRGVSHDQTWIDVVARHSRWCSWQVDPVDDSNNHSRVLRRGRTLSLVLPGVALIPASWQWRRDVTNLVSVGDGNAEVSDRVVLYVHEDRRSRSSVGKANGRVGSHCRRGEAACGEFKDDAWRSVAAHCF